MSYFPDPYTHSKSKTKVVLALSNYATKSNLKNATGVGAPKFPEKANLANLRSYIAKLDID